MRVFLSVIVALVALFAGGCGGNSSVFGPTPATLLLKPDLVAVTTGFETNPDPVIAGANVILEAVISNAGGVDARSFQVRGQLWFGGVQWDERVVRFDTGLNRSSTDIASFNFTIPNTMSGTWRLVVMVDDIDEVSEDNGTGDAEFNWSDPAFSSPWPPGAPPTATNNVVTYVFTAFPSGST